MGSTPAPISTGQLAPKEYSKGRADPLIIFSQVTGTVVGSNPILSTKFTSMDMNKIILISDKNRERFMEQNQRVAISPMR